MLIYVEGPAGAGKTSFINYVHEHNPEFAVIEEYVRDEDESINKALDTFVSNTDLKLEMVSQLDKNKVYLVDRGYLSLLVNSFVEQSHGLNDSYDQATKWLKETVSANQIVAPDLYVYISAPVKLIIDRAVENGWFRDDLGWTVDPQMAMEKYEGLFAEHASGIPIIRLDGKKNSSVLAEEFLSQFRTYA